MNTPARLQRPVLIAVACLIAGCSHGVHHRVKAGETLFRISKAYGVSVAELTRANRISDPSRIEVGDELVIPGADNSVPVDLVAPKSVSLRGTPQRPAPSGNLALQWPVRRGQVSSHFGTRDGNVHDGVDITAPVGTPIFAAAAGEVIYADTLRGYGNVVIVRHPSGFATVYAHNDKNLVRAGQPVTRGEQIATLGDSGRTTGANLHFEVRQDNIARDPLPYLPAEPRPPALTVRAAD